MEIFSNTEGTSAPYFLAFTAKTDKLVKIPVKIHKDNILEAVYRGEVLYIADCKAREQLVALESRLLESGDKAIKQDIKDLNWDEVMVKNYIQPTLSTGTQLTDPVQKFIDYLSQGLDEGAQALLKIAVAIRAEAAKEESINIVLTHSLIERVATERNKTVEKLVDSMSPRIKNWLMRKEPLKLELIDKEMDKVITELNALDPLDGFKQAYDLIFPPAMAKEIGIYVAHPLNWSALSFRFPFRLSDIAWTNELKLGYPAMLGSQDMPVRCRVQGSINHETINALLTCNENKSVRLGVLSPEHKYMQAVAEILAIRKQAKLEQEISIEVELA